jgi:hypothetical protein
MRASAPTSNARGSHRKKASGPILSGALTRISKTARERAAIVLTERQFRT